MKKINVFILFSIALFLIFTCSEPSENLSSNSKMFDSGVTHSLEFITPGTYSWQVPENVVGNLTVTLVGGGGSGFRGVVSGGGGGGAGQLIEENIIVPTNMNISITVGHGGGSELSGENSQITIISKEVITYTALGGFRGSGVSGGSGYPSGANGTSSRGGNGGNNGRGYGQGGSSGNNGSSAPANSGGGGGGSDGAGGGAGGSGYVKIEYTVAE